MKVKSICILGGGTSGFAMSAALARYREFSGIDFDIQVVYSKSIGSIGVGESTILEINKLLDYFEDGGELMDDEMFEDGGYFDDYEDGGELDEDFD